MAVATLELLSGPASKYLFVLGVGCLAVPVMAIGAAHDLAQGFGSASSLHAKPAEAPFFYRTIALVTLVPCC